jgi:hypothetical protein
VTKKGKKDSTFVTFAYEKERHAACIADLKEGDKAKSFALKQKQDEWGFEYATRELERQRALLGEATGTDGFGWWDTSKGVNNAIEGAQEDALNGMGSTLTDRQRKILKMGK